MFKYMKTKCNKKMKKTLFFLVQLVALNVSAQSLSIGLTTTSTLYSLDNTTRFTARPNMGVEVMYAQKFGKSLMLSAGIGTNRFLYDAVFTENPDVKPKFFLNTRIFEIPLLLRYNFNKSGLYLSSGFALYAARSRNFIGRTGYQASGVSAMYTGTITDNWLNGIAPKIVVGKTIFKNKVSVELAGTFNNKVPEYSILQKTSGVINLSKPLARINILSLGLKYTVFDK